MITPSELMIFDMLMHDSRIGLNCSMYSMNETQEAIELRLEMVEDQLIRRGIHETSILDAFKAIPRHIFVPQVSVMDAYTDQPLPIKAGQTISQPYIVAQMISYLDLRPEHRVLEIGSGSGYATAIMSKLCQRIHAIEVYQELIDDSHKVLTQLDLTNIDIVHQSAWEQFEANDVYDRIILWASPPRIPEHIFDKLGHNGIMVAPEGKTEQYVWIYKMNNGNLSRERKDPVRFVPLVQGSVNEIDFNQ